MKDRQQIDREWNQDVVMFTDRMRALTIGLDVEREKQQVRSLAIQSA